MQELDRGICYALTWNLMSLTTQRMQVVFCWPMDLCLWGMECGGL